MGAILGMVLGAMTGLGAGSVHRYVNAGWYVSLPAGALGGYLGSQWFGGSFAPLVGDSGLAGAALGGAVGGIVVAVIAGAVIVTLRSRRR